MQVSVVCFADFYNQQILTRESILLLEATRGCLCSVRQDIGTRHPAELATTSKVAVRLPEVFGMAEIIRRTDDRRAILPFG